MSKVYILIFIFLSLNAESEQLPLRSIRFECREMDKIQILSVKSEKISWHEKIESNKVLKEKLFYIANINGINSKNFYKNSSILLKDDPKIIGNVNIFTFQKHINESLKLKFNRLIQAVILPENINCADVEPKNNFIFGRYRNQKNKDKTKNKELFELKKEEVFLFDESGYSYYFYPPNYISKFKNLKDNRKQFVQTIYLFSMAIDSNFKLIYPSQKELFEKFELFKKDKLEKALDVETGTLVDSIFYKLS